MSHNPYTIDNLNPTLVTYLPVMDAVVRLFTPFVEAAMHDLTSGKIVAIYNNFSNRVVGDKSPLRELGIPVEEFPDVFEPYYKTNWDGRMLKCTSITIRDENGKALALVCFNFDTSQLGDLQVNLARLLEVPPASANPVEAFGGNWNEQIKTAINAYIEPRNLTVDRLSREHKRELVQDLYRQGIFNYKNAAVVVSKTLRISRASVYNYMKMGTPNDASL